MALAISLIAIAGAGAEGGHDAWQAHQNAADVALEAKDFAKAEAELLAAYEEAVHFSALDRRLDETLRGIHLVRADLVKNGRAVEADALADGLVRKAEAIRGPDHAVRLEVERRIARQDMVMRRWQAALPRLERLRADSERSLGAGDVRTIRAALLLAQVDFETDRLDEAHALAAAARTQAENALGSERAEISRAVALMARVEIRRGNLDEAVALAKGGKATGTDGQNLGVMYLELSTALRTAGRASESLTWARRSMEALEQTFGENILVLAAPLTALSEANLSAGRYVAAHRNAQRLLESTRRAGLPGLLGGALLTASAVEATLRRWDPAAAYLEEAVALYRSTGGMKDRLQKARGALAHVEQQRGNTEQARVLYEQRSLEAGIDHGARSRPYAMAVNDLAYFEVLAGNTSEADALMRKSFEAAPLDPDHDASRLDTLGVIRLRQGRREEALRNLETALERIPPHSTGRYEVSAHLHEALLATGQDERAATIEAELAELARGIEDARKILAASVARDDSFVSEPFNFRMDAPPSGWKNFDAAAVNPVAVVGRSRTNPLSYFMLVPTVRGNAPFELAGVGRGVSESFATAFDEIVIVEEGARTFSGMEGWLLEARTRTARQRFAWAIWTTVQNGVAYQFYVWSDHARSSTGALVTDLGGFAEGFSLLDPEKTLGPSLEYVTELRSDRFGYSVALPGGKWFPWGSLPGFADAGSLSKDESAVIVVPVSYLGQQIAPADAEAALLALADQRLPPQAERRGAEGLSEARFDASRVFDGVPFRYRCRVVTGDSAGWLVMAWTKDGNDLAVLDVVDAAHLVPAKVSVERLADMSPPDRARHGTFFNSVGLSRFSRGQTAAAIEIQRVAIEASPEPLYLKNLAHILITAGRPADAVELLRVEHGALVETHPELLAYRAWARGQAGDRAQAIADYERAFASGFEDANSFQDYAEQLWLGGDQDRAMGITEREIARTRSPQLMRLHATFQQRKGDVDAAIATLREVTDEHPGDVEGIHLLGDVYMSADRFSEALEAYDRAAVLEGDSLRVHYRRASALFGLGRYRDSKAELEAALEIDPSAQEVRRDLEHVSAMLGEGENTTLKTALEPVPVFGEAQPADQPLPASELGGAGAYWSLRSIGIRYRKGVEHVKTVRQVIHVVDRSGVDAMSTRTIDFHPLTEEIFINELSVRDSSGKVLARADVSDFYVLDDAGQMATSGKTIHLPVPGLTPGRIIHLTYTSRDRTPPEEFPLLEATFSQTLPVVRSEVYVLADPDQLRYEHSAGVTERRKPDGISWTVDRSPAYRWEPLQANYRTFLPWTLVGDANGSWASEGRRYLEDIAERLDPDEALRALAARETEGARTADEKARALEEYVREYLTYEAIEFGRRARLPNRIPEILERRYGDCKDHALMLHQLLGYAGVTSHLALVSLSSPIVASVPSLDQFDHMIVHCADCASSAYLDPTGKHWSAADEPPLHLGLRSALILDRDAPRLDRLSAYRGEHHYVDADRALEVGSDGNAVVREELTLGGYAAAAIRTLLTEIDQANWKEAIQQAYLRDLGPLKLRHLEVQHLHESRTPLEIGLEYEIDGAFQQTDTGMVGRIPAPLERAFLGGDSTDDRLAPFEIEFPIRLSGTVQIVADREVTFFGEPETSETGRFGSWRSTARQQAGTELRWEIQRFTGQYPAGDYSSFVEEMNRSFSAISRGIRFDTPSPAR